MSRLTINKSLTLSVASSLRRLKLTSLIFKMSTPTERSKHEWIIILPDQEGALDRRMKVRQDHLAGIQTAVEAGFWTFGGAYLEEVLKEGEPPKMRGSIMLAMAESKEEVIEVLKKDIYSRSDVWDLDKIQIYPFRTAIRTAL